MRTIDLTTEQMTYGGAALARHEGLIVFVPYALPGERVRVGVETSKKGWAKAELVEVLQPSPDRVEPACPHFGAQRCGGCHWQHIRYEAQLRYKHEVVREQLQRIAGLDQPPVEPCLGMSEPWHYRNHVQLRNSNQGLGFVRADKQGIYAIESCLTMNPAIHSLFVATQKSANQPFKRLVLRGSDVTGERLAIIEGKSSEGLMSQLPKDCHIVKRDRKARVRAIRGNVAYHEEMNQQQWRVHANSFFQVNTSQAEQLLHIVKTLLLPLRGDEVLLDCYAGVGLFGLSLADLVKQVYLVESHPNAVADARRHARSIENATVVKASAEHALLHWSQYGSQPDLVLLDPPRAGCKELVLHQLAKMAIPTIIYVSCDPTTQARDIRRLVDLGYRLDMVQPIDLFPHTYHIESVARLRYIIE